MLATITVGNTLDIVNGDTSSIAALLAKPGDDGISLREAIEATNSTAGADTIDFDVSLFSTSQIITLENDQFWIRDSLAIQGPGPDRLTLDAGDGIDGIFGTGDGHRIFLIHDDNRETQSDVILEGLTLTGGDAGAGGDFNGLSGGAIDSTEHLVLKNSSVINNSAGDARENSWINYGGDGGGIHSFEGDVTLIDSVLKNNRAGNGAYVHSGENGGSGGSGGGLYSWRGSVSIIRSIVSGNTAGDGGGGQYIGRRGTGGGGGGIASQWGSVTISESIISDNRAGNSGEALDNRILEGNGGNGGGVELHHGSLLVETSTVSNNVAGDGGVGGNGGGVRGFSSNLSFIKSTISGNVSGFGTYPNLPVAGGGYGGGIYSRHGQVSLESTTLTKNHAKRSGGGIAGTDYVGTTLTSQNAIIAANTDTGGNPNFRLNSTSLLRVDHSVIGHTTGSMIDSSTGVGNQINSDPLLAPLADNGGPTPTHALLPGSPALDAGDPNITFSASEFDQRGNGFFRVADGGSGLRIDIGAYESQGIPNLPAGDYNGDGIADAADYTLWRKTLGSITDLRADGNGNNLVDEADFKFWRSNYGNTTVTTTPLSVATDPESESIASDAAFALFTSPYRMQTLPTATVRVTNEYRVSNINHGDELLLLSRVSARPSEKEPVPVGGRSTGLVDGEKALEASSENVLEIALGQF